MSPPEVRAPEIAFVVLVFSSAAWSGPGLDQPLGATAWLSAVAVLGLWVLHREGRPGPGWTLGQPRRLVWWMVLGVAVAVGVWVVVGAMRLAGDWVLGPHPLHPWWAVSSVYNVPLAMLWLVVVLGPIVEEIVFRGLLYRGLRRRVRVPAAVALSSFVFVVGHVAGAPGVGY